MTVTNFQDLPLADRDRAWDGAAAEKRVRKWAHAEDGPNQRYRDAHVWYDAESKQNFTAYKLLIADVADGKLKAVPRSVMAAGAIMQGGHGGIDTPQDDIARVKSHHAKYYTKAGDEPPLEAGLVGGVAKQRSCHGDRRQVPEPFALVESGHELSTAPHGWEQRKWRRRAD